TLRIIPLVDGSITEKRFQVSRLHHKSYGGQAGVRCQEIEVGWRVAGGGLWRVRKAGKTARQPKLLK
ncbi:MAG: hypothetical protein PVI49_08930, partial [Desulfobacterales bacterium]